VLLINAQRLPLAAQPQAQTQAGIAMAAATATAAWVLYCSISTLQSSWVGFCSAVVSFCNQAGWGCALLLSLSLLQVNSEDFDGWLALHVACYYGAAGVADMLLRKGAQVMARTSKGQTPLHIAVEMAESQWLNRDYNYGLTIQLLIGAGALIDAQDSLNNTPLQVWAVCWEATSGESPAAATAVVVSAVVLAAVGRLQDCDGNVLGSSVQQLGRSVGKSPQQALLAGQQSVARRDACAVLSSKSSILQWRAR
jgi:hypothetical protein